MAKRVTRNFQDLNILFQFLTEDMIVPESMNMNNQLSQHFRLGFIMRTLEKKGDNH